MITAITYGDNQYLTSIKLNQWSARKVGKIDRVIAYHRSEIDDEFYNKHKSILDQKRGGGYWLWKPYFIKKTMENLPENDYLLFTDAALYFVHSIDTIIQHMEKYNINVFLSGSCLPNAHWCKKETFEAMSCDEKAGEITQVESGFILFKINNETRRFVDKWLDYACDYKLITDCDETERDNQSPIFKEHRHDQAILTNLAYLEGIQSNKGVAGRSEYKYYVNYKDGQFWGYTRNELKNMALAEEKKDYFLRSNYGRIVVNTRIDTNNKFIFALRLIKKTYEAIKIDTIGKIKANWRRRK